MTATARTAFDVLIVGAGLAGSATATLLARAGWSVALVERLPFPRRKVCGECMAASNLPLLQALGVGDAFLARAGPELRQVTLLHRDSAATADLPPADPGQGAWGRALGRETLDGLLLEAARTAGATVFQPWAVKSIVGTAGAWHCELIAPESTALMRLRATLVIDAHGSWEPLPTDRLQRRLARSAADLFAFKANFTAASWPAGDIGVLALNGGYGGMVVADNGVTTVACCIRRDRLTALRSATPGLRAGDVVEAWLRQECIGVRRALDGAERDGAWLTAGPLDPGVRLTDDDAVFRIGNAAGEAHPILGEGMSMALQSAWLLCQHLLGAAGTAGTAIAAGSPAVPEGLAQPGIQRRYAAAWREEFVPRLRLAAVFAHAAMSPRGAAALMRLAQTWPGLLTHGARWGGKIRYAQSRSTRALSPTTPPALESRAAVGNALPGS